MGYKKWVHMPRPSMHYVSLRVVRFYVQLSKFSDFAISMRDHKDSSEPYKDMNASYKGVVCGEPMMSLR